MVDSADGRACRQQRDLLRFWRRERVGDRASRPGLRLLRLSSRYSRAVDARKLLTRGGSRLDSVGRHAQPSRAATRSKTSARSIRSGWPGGVTWAPNRWRCDEDHVRRSGRTAARAAAFERRRASARAPDASLRPSLRSHPATNSGGANHDGDRGERPRDLGAIPARRLPEAIRFDVKRQDRMAGRAREPHRAGLRDARRPARPVDRERDRPAGGQIAPQLHERARRAARRRAARRAEAEARRGSRRSTRRRSSGW